MHFPNHPQERPGCSHSQDMAQSKKMGFREMVSQLSVRRIPSFASPKENEDTPPGASAEMNYGYGDAAPTTAFRRLARRASNLGSSGPFEKKPAESSADTDYGYGDAAPTTALRRLARRASNLGSSASFTKNSEEQQEQPRARQNRRGSAMGIAAGRRCSALPAVGRRGSALGGLAMAVSRRCSALPAVGRHGSTTFGTNGAKSFPPNGQRRGSMMASTPASSHRAPPQNGTRQVKAAGSTRKFYPRTRQSKQQTSTPYATNSSTFMDEKENPVPATVTNPEDVAISSPIKKKIKNGECETEEQQMDHQYVPSPRRIKDPGLPCWGDLDIEDVVMLENKSVCRPESAAEVPQARDIMSDDSCSSCVYLNDGSILV